MNHSVTAEVVDMDDGNISLLSMPDYVSDVPQYSGMGHCFDDGGISRYRDSLAAVSSVKDIRHDDSLDPKGSGKPQSSRKMTAERDVLAVGSKKRSKEEEEDQKPLCQQFIFEKSDTNIFESDESHVEIRDTLNLMDITPLSPVDDILRSLAATAPISSPRNINKLMESVFTDSDEILDCTLAASTTASSTNVVDGSQRSISKGRSYLPPRRVIRQRIGRPLKASTSSFSACRRLLISKLLTQLLSSSVNYSQSGDAAAPSSVNTFTKSQRARLTSHLRRLQSPSTSRISGRRRNLSRSPTSAATRTPSHERAIENSGPPGHSIRSRNTLAVHPTLLKTHDGRIIVMRQRPTGGGPSIVRTVSNYSSTESESSKVDPKQQINEARPKVDAPGCSIYDSMRITSTPQDKLLCQLPCFSKFEKPQTGAGFIKHMRSIQQKLDVHISDDDRCESKEETATANLPPTSVIGREERKRKLGIVCPPVASFIGSKDNKDEACRLDSTPPNSSASSDANASKSGVAVTKSKEESDDQNASLIFKKPRIELFKIRKNKQTDF